MEPLQGRCGQRCPRLSDLSSRQRTTGSLTGLSRYFYTRRIFGDFDAALGKRCGCCFGFSGQGLNVLDHPRLFGKFCLLERISVGGMAEVFRAKPLNAPDPDRYFALKRILPHLAEDIEFIKMFVDEAQLTVRLDHPNIVQTYELGQFQASHYIVMEFIAGKDLLAFQKYVRRQKTTVNIDTCCHIMAQVAKGLDYAHRRCDEDGNPLGIIHRDVSPQNILVSWDGRVRVIDFGVAKAASQSTKTKAGVLKGKFGYLSPEQVRAETIDRRSDIFAMGTLFWELLTNRRLFNASNQYETMMMISDPEVKPPSSINPAVPKEVDELAMKALAADRENRYQWASEFAADLEAFLRTQKPPYHSSQLTTWLRSSFNEEFEEEREKRERFRSINSADDVRREVSQEGQAGGDMDQQAGDATQIWDVEEAPEADEDIDRFVANHTVVAAGGLELDDYDDWEDAPDTIQDIEAPEGDGQASPQQESVPARSGPIKIEASSRYEAEETVVTGDFPSVEARRSLPEEQEESRPQTIDAAMLTPEPMAKPEGARARAAGDEKKTDRLDAVTSEPTPVPQARPSANEGGGSTRLVIAAAGALLLFVGAGLASAWVILGDEQEESEAMTWGGMIVEAQPASGLSVAIDGQEVPAEMPLTMEELGAGDYEVRSDHPDHPPWVGTVTVVEGEVTRVVADLADKGELILSWAGEQPQEMEILVGDESHGPEVKGESIALPRGEYIVEIRGEGLRPIRKGVVVEGQQQLELDLKLEADDQLTIYGDEELEVSLDGRAHGQLPLTLADLVMDRSYELAIGDHEGWLGFPALGKGELQAEAWKQREPLEEEDLGWLVLDLEADGMWSLGIDGSEPVLVWPMRWEQLPVEAGSRELTFQRGDRKLSLEVHIEGGERTIVRGALN